MISSSNRKERKKEIQVALLVMAGSLSENDREKNNGNDRDERAEERIKNQRHKVTITFTE